MYPGPGNASWSARKCFLTKRRDLQSTVVVRWTIVTIPLTDANPLTDRRVSETLDVFPSFPRVFRVLKHTLAESRAPEIVICFKRRLGNFSRDYGKGLLDCYDREHASEFYERAGLKGAAGLLPAMKQPSLDVDFKWKAKWTGSKEILPDVGRLGNWKTIEKFWRIAEIF